MPEDVAVPDPPGGDGGGGGHGRMNPVAPRGLCLRGTSRSAARSREDGGPQHAPATTTLLLMLRILPGKDRAGHLHETSC